MIRFEKRAFVRCDGCGAEHRSGADETSAMGARIAAGRDGWRFTQKGGGTGNRDQRHYDYCPNCGAP